MNIWKTQATQLKTNCIQYKILNKSSGLTLSRGEVIDLWINHLAFRKYYNTILQDCPFQAFYWENPSTTRAQLTADYEFVLIESSALTRLKPEPDTFKKYYTNEDKVVLFPNLGKDALLVVPAPISDVSHYTHLAVFVRNAPLEQIDELWQKLGLAYQAAIGEEKKWLSTAGLGVYWLHLRIDSRPKYYKWEEYKVGV